MEFKKYYFYLSLRILILTFGRKYVQAYNNQTVLSPGMKNLEKMLKGNYGVHYTYWLHQSIQTIFQIFKHIIN